MKLFGVLLTVAFLVAGLSKCDSVKAQPSGNLVSPNLIYMTTNPWQGQAGTNPGSWNNNFTASSTATGGGLSGGNQPAYNTTNGTFIFGYTQATIAYTYALSTALQNSGMTWTGYNYSWNYINQDYTRGSLTANIGFNAKDGTSLYSKSWTLGPTTNGWTTMSGTETFTNPGLLASSLANFKLSFTGKDDRYWAGYYGPQVQNPSITINYTFDQCSSNPLSSPSCSGYAAAYQTQQCSANPLYSTACPGYQAAYTTQQCSANPLYSTACPGYQAAYLTAQCTNNPLYSMSCPGYQQAYHDQQCTVNPLFATDCPGYQAAYTAQQCSINPLYATTCPGYQAAYKTQQCSISPLYASDCPGYQQAYHDQQCSINPLFAADCPGYQQAYLNAQCIKDSLYSPLCSGYKTAYAIKYLVPNIDSSAVNQSLSGTASVAASNPTSVNTNGTVSSTGTVTTTPSATGNTTVDNVISTPSTTSTTSATSVSPAATNSVVTPSAPVGSPMGQAMNTPQSSGQQGSNQQQGPQSSQGGGQQQVSNGPRKEPPNKEQQQEKQKEAVSANKNAKSLDEQKAAQNALIASMGLVPGFDAYNNVVIRDSLFYRPFDIYKNQGNVDNRKNSYGLFGPSDQQHNEMVSQQYKLGENKNGN